MNKPLRLRKNAKDLTGQKFGLLTAIEPTGFRTRTYLEWKFQCECGNTINASVNDVNRYNRRSCGCQTLKQVDGVLQEKSTYLYRFWLLQRSFCINKNTRNYRWLGALGITFSPDWQEYKPFEQAVLALPNCPDDWNKRVIERKTFLGRIDRNGNFEPGNMQWTTLQPGQIHRI